MNQPKAASSTTLIGREHRNVDGIAKVTGAGAFIADMALPGMLWGKILRSPYPHAEIVALDTTAAEALPGVRAVIDYRDAPANALDIELASDSPVYVLERTMRHNGDEVAAVAADTPEIAEAALQLIEVQYRELPAVFDPEEALRPGAPLARPSGNLASGRPVLLERGDVAAGMAQAEVIVEDIYATGPTSAIPLEPRGCIAAWEGDQLTVWKSGRNSHGDRQRLASVLGLPVGRVRVLSPFVGGSFGNKDESRLQYLAALLARKAGRPVKMLFSFAEELRCGRWRHPSLTHIRMGLRRDGSITAIEAQCVMNTGPYVPGINVVRRAGHAITYLYRCPNVRFEGRVAYTNSPVAGSYRALGAPQGHFALESHVDKAAEALGMDPLAFRRLNQVPPEGQAGEPWRAGERLVPAQPIEGGIPFSSNGLDECLSRGAEAAGWTPRPDGPRRQRVRLDDGREVLRGLGMAASIYQTGQAASSAIVRVNADGSADVIMGTLDVGQGSNTVLSIIAAETLGLPLSSVSGYFADSASTPFAHATAGSTTTFSSGIAVRQAALDARRQLLEQASRFLEAAPEELAIEDGEVFLPAIPERRLSLRELLGRVQPPQVIGRAETRAGSDSSIVNSFSAHFAEVEVDPETGQVRILRYVAAHDCGRPINVQAVKGQIYGGVLQGIGYALTEQIEVDPTTGNPSVANLDSFKIPTVRDIPGSFEVILAGTVDPVGPYGAKAIGEPPLAIPAAAIANAVYDATGVRLRSLPLTPERILAGLRAMQST